MTNGSAPGPTAYSTQCISADSGRSGDSWPCILIAQTVSLRSWQVCVRCTREKAASAFNRNKVRPDGLCSYCKVCNAAAAAERRKTRKPVLQPTVTHKVGPICRQARAPSAGRHTVYTSSYA